MSTSILSKNDDSYKQSNSSKGITTKTFLNMFNAIETVVNGFARMITNIFTFSITEIAPMVAPLPPAFSIYMAMSERLHVPFYVSIVASVAIEIIGMFSSKVSIRCYQWNTAKTKSEQSVPQGLSILMTSVFFVVVLLLALTVELAPSLTALVIPGFVLIAISVYVNLAIHTNLEKLEIDKANTLELREIKNGISAQIREAKKYLQTLTEQAKQLTEQIKTAKQELTTKRQEYDNLLATFDTQIDTRQKELDTLIAQIEAKQNELSMAQNMVSNGHMTPIKTTNLETANKAKETKIDLRRQEVLRLLEQGMSQADIATELEVSIATVKRDIKVLNGKVVTK